MFEKQKKEYPEVVVRSLIINNENEILLAKNSKWNGLYTVFGGHVEKGETLEEAVLRETKEETDLDVEIIAELGFGDSVFHEDFNGNRHFIFIDYLCRYNGNENDVNLDKREYIEGEYVWVSLEKTKQMNLAIGSKQIIERYEKYLGNQEYLEGWKRCQADFDNYRKRQDERMKDLGNSVKEDLVLQILPVLDNFQMSLDHVPEDQSQSAWIQGILHIQRQLESILKDNSIEKIEAKEGDEFNPEIHEAVENHQEEEREDCHRIKKVILRGYRTGEKIIRPARVIVE